MSTVEVGPAIRVQGTVTVPGDKSISHRALILGALARGRTYLGGLSPALDVESTAACLRACGAAVRPFGDGRVSLEGAGAGRSLSSPAEALDCGNSGTTMRLLAGALAGHAVEAVLDGDASLRRRPMRRVVEPLRAMGAEVSAAEGGRPPLRVHGRRPLRGGEHVLEVASAQVKSAILLAALSAEAPVSVLEPSPSRDHTERMLRLCGLDVAVDGTRVTLTPGNPQGFGLRIPGDLSSAAFLLALAAGVTGSRVRCPGVTLNPGRTGILEVLRAMGATVVVEEGEAAAGVEPAGDVEVRGGPLRACTVEGDLVPRCIDEIPVIAVLAAAAEGTTVIRDAAELRVKESDRLALVAGGLRSMGAAVEETADGLAITGPVRLHPAALESAGDHRLAMAWAVAASLAHGGRSRIDGAEAVAVSYPGFFADLGALTGS